MIQSAHNPTDPPTTTETPQGWEPTPEPATPPASEPEQVPATRPAHRAVRAGHGIHGSSSELPPDMRHISASAAVRSPGSPHLSTTSSASGASNASATSTSSTSSTSSDETMRLAHVSTTGATDETPTILLPVIGAIKQLTLGRLLAGAAGVVVLIIVGLLVLNVLVPTDGKNTGAALPANNIAQPGEPGRAQPVKYQPVTDLCDRVDTTPLKGLFPTITAADQGTQCSLTLENKPAASTPRKPSQHRAGSLQVTAEYFTNQAGALALYTDNVADPAVLLVEGVGDQAGVFVIPQGKNATLRMYVLDDNLLLDVTGKVSREDKDWTAEDLESLRKTWVLFAAGTLKKL